VSMIWKSPPFQVLLLIASWSLFFIRLMGKLWLEKFFLSDFELFSGWSNISQLNNQANRLR
jgi:hypothetical protein